MRTATSLRRPPRFGVENLLNDYYYDERNNLLVMEHVGDYVGAEFQTVVPELLEKVQGQVNYIIIDMSKVTSATIIDTDLFLRRRVEITSFNAAPSGDVITPIDDG